jgi:predicted XRE-type DNA-binding protein
VTVTDGASGERFDDIWDAISKNSEEAQAMRERSMLLCLINDRIDEKRWLQKVAARKLGVTQPAVSRLRNGMISKFSLEKLIELARRAGYAVEIVVHDPGAAENDRGHDG